MSLEGRAVQPTGGQTERWPLPVDSTLRRKALTVDHEAQSSANRRGTSAHGPTATLPQWTPQPWREYVPCYPTSARLSEIYYKHELSVALKKNTLLVQNLDVNINKGGSNWNELCEPTAEPRIHSRDHTHMQNTTTRTIPMLENHHFFYSFYKKTHTA